MNFKAVLALPKTAGSSLTHSISFTLISLGGTKGKMLENQHIVMAIFQHFSFGNYEQKSCLDKLKF